MCFNKEISLATFIFAIVGIVYLYNRNAPNDRWIAVFAAVLAMIQLAEFLMWSDQSCGNLNKYASMFALFILALQPLSNMIGGIFFSNTPYKNILGYMLFAYLLFIGYVYFSFVSGKQIVFCGINNCAYVPQANNSIKSCGLNWLFIKNMGRKTSIIWILFLMLPFLTMTPTFRGIILFALAVATYFASRMSHTNIMASMWCWFAIGLIYFQILF